MKFSWLIFGLALLGMLSSCKESEDEMPEKEITTYDSGIFVVNQGNADVANGTISFYQRDCEQVVSNIFLKANTANQLGNDLQDLLVIGDRAYILSAQANTLTIVDADDFSYIGNIRGFAQPQDMLAVNDQKIYVSQWGADGFTGSIEVVDLNNLQIINSIPTRGGPGKMIRQGPAVYVANSGGFGLDSIISKIDGTSDLFLKTIAVGPNPVDLVEDKNGAIWALCSGVLSNFQNPQAPENTPGALIRVQNDAAEFSLPLVAGARNLVINTAADKLYFINNNWTYEHPINQQSLNLSPFLDLSFTAYAIDPQSGYLAAANALDFKKQGEVVLFDLSTAMAVDTFAVGIVPIAFGFR